MKRARALIEKLIYIMSNQQKRLCIIVLMLTCLSSLLECLGVSIILPIVEVIQNPEQIRNSNLFRDVNYLNDFSDKKIIVLVVSIGIFIYVLKTFFFITMTWIRAKFSSKVQRELSVRMMNSYMGRGYQFFLEHNYGQLHRGVIGDTASVYNALCALLKFFSEILTIILICVFMFVADWRMAGAIVILAIISLVIIYFFFRRSMYQTGEIYREYEAKSSQDLVHAFHGAKDILVLRKQRYFVDVFEKNKEIMQKAQCKQSVGMESPAYVIEGVCVCGLMAMICARIAFSGTDDNFIAVLASFAVGAFRILPSLGKISAAINTIETVIPSVDILYNQFLEAEQYANEHPESLGEIRKIRSKWGLINTGSEPTNTSMIKEHEKEVAFKDKLELKNVSFRYEEERQNVLQSINLTIERGTSVALIGSSGAGKSTLVDVILGLLVPQQGAIYLDNTKITDIPEVWSRVVGYVPQSVYLIDASIEENIAFGEDIIDSERVKEVLAKAGLYSFIESLPLGVNTIVGDRGVRLSGGQRQRIAIARALYHNPQILVLDEATSALDNETERAIMSAIELLQGEVTLIIVAHRLTTVRNCDIIYEVVDGQIEIRDKDSLFCHK